MTVDSKSKYGTYKLIYIWKPEDNEAYKVANPKLLKIGQATLHATKPISKYTQDELNEIAKKDRIKTYTQTAALKVNVLYTAIALSNTGLGFKDHDVHRVLKSNGITRTIFADSNALEWYDVDLNVAIAAVKSLIDENDQIMAEALNNSKPEKPIFVPRNEQKEAVKKTLKNWAAYHKNPEKNSSQFLWNAKPRFGKTATAYMFIKESGLKNLGSKNELEYKPIRKVLVATHRPVVNDAWAKDAAWILPDYTYESKNYLEGAVVKDWFSNTSGDFIRFASIQDIRQEKNSETSREEQERLFSEDYDLLILDEGHEGTETELAEAAFEKIKRKFTLYLSGTPFKQLVNQKFADNEIYTWDYIDEQKTKEDWYKANPGKSNPYSSLASITVSTIDLRQTATDKEKFGELMDENTFRFGKFFETENTNNNQVNNLEDDESNVSGDWEFTDRQRISNFLDRLVKSEESETSTTAFMPYSNEMWSHNRHSLWMLPTVASVKALKKMLSEHTAFRNYTIIDATGGEGSNALAEVLEAIHGTQNPRCDGSDPKQPWESSSITLSVGRLALGVSVPGWSTVLMLRNVSSPSLYMQTMFRGQTPCKTFNKVDGKVLPKTQCRVYDFAPDRTLRVLATAAEVSGKTGGSKIEDDTERREILEEFLTYCPVLAFDGNSMKAHNTDSMMESLKKIYSSRAVDRGFDDPALWDMSKLLNLKNADLDHFTLLNGLMSAATKKKDFEYTINESGLEGEDYEKIYKEEKEKKQKLKDAGEKPLKTEEEKELDRRKDLARSASAQLRAISIRIPLMILGAKTEQKWDKVGAFHIEDFPDLFNDADWEEFMQKITKEIFLQTVVYFDQDVLRASIKDWLHRVDDAINRPSYERFEAITHLLSLLKNPDKETVITPKNVAELVIDKANVDWEEAAIGEFSFFEINSKSGIFPLVELQKLSQVWEIDETEEVDSSGSYVGRRVAIDSGIERIPSKTYEAKYSSGVFKEEYSNSWEYLIESHIFANARTKAGKNITLRVLGVDRGSVASRNFTSIDVIALKRVIDNEFNKLKKISKNSSVSGDLIADVNAGWLVDGKIDAHVFIGLVLRAANTGFVLRSLRKNLKDSAEFDSLSVLAESWSRAVRVLVEEILDDADPIVGIAKLRALLGGFGYNELYDEFFGVEEFGSFIMSFDDEVFDFLLSNPPYQVETAVKPGQEQPTVTNVFQEFQILAFKLAKTTCMIYPAGRWIQKSGKGLREFGEKFLNDPSLISIDYYPNGDEKNIDKIFPEIRIPDGVSIVLWDSKVDSATFHFSGKEIVRPGEKLLPVNKETLEISLKMIDYFHKEHRSSLLNKVSARSLFSIESSYVEENKEKVFLCDLHANPPNALIDPIKLFTNDKAGKGGTPRWYWTEKSNIKINHSMINRWQVVCPSAVQSFVNGIKLDIIPSGAAHGRVRLSIIDFSTEKEAINFKKYASTKLIQLLFVSSKDAGLSGFGSFVPDLEDYTNNNPIFKTDEELGEDHEYFGLTLDERLYKLFNLTEDEIEIVERG